MKRYLALYVKFLQFSLSKALEFRANFFFGILITIIEVIIELLFFKILFLNNLYFASWSESDTYLFVGVYLFIIGILSTFIYPNLFEFSTMINRGALDYYLVRPVHTLFFISFKDIVLQNIFLALLGLGIIIINTVPRYLSLMRIFLFIIALFLGTFLAFLLKLILTIPAIWTHSNRGTDDLYGILSSTAQKPYMIFTNIWKYIFTVIIPFTVTTSFPVVILIESNFIRPFLYMLLITVIFTLVAYSFWKIALKHYSSASS